MKKLTFICLFGFLLHVSHAQPVEWLNGRKYEDDMPTGVYLTVKFPFKNISGDTLRVELVRTTCGCTVAEWTKEPVPPGQEGKITVEYHPQGERHFRKRILVFFEGIRRAEKLIIKGNIYDGCE